MALTLRTTARTGIAQAVITDAGAAAKLKIYNGAKPAALGAPAGTLLATLTFGATIGTATAGALDFDEAGATQNNATHVAGTPTFSRISTSADVAVMDIDVGAAPSSWPFTGNVVNGQNVTLTALVFTAPHA